MDAQTEELLDTIAPMVEKGALVGASIINGFGRSKFKK